MLERFRDATVVMLALAVVASCGPKQPQPQERKELTPAEKESPWVNKD